METRSSWKVKKWLTIGGSFLMMLPVGLPWYWGNIGMYALSFTAMRGNVKTGVDTPWIISTYFLCNFVGIYMVGFVWKPVTKRLMLLFGILLFAGGIYATFYTVRISVLMITMSLGVVSGVGGGIINGMALRYGVAWAGRNLGLVTAFVQSGFNTGPLFINPLVTLYVNPSNVSPSIETGSIKLFDQSDLLDRVPFAFIVFGTVCLVLQLLGLVSVRELMEKSPEEKDLTPEGSESSERSDNTEVSVVEEVKDKNPREMLRSKSFYVIWVAFMLFDNAMLVLANYYKDYGAVWIEDDYFLAFLGNALTIATIVGFSSWGFVSDRMGIKKTMILMLCVSSMLSLLAYFTPMFSKWLYMINIILLGFFLPPIFSILIIATCRVFGKTYHTTNMVYAASFSLATNFVNPLVFQGFVSLGWFYVFCYAGGLCASSMVLIILTLPDI